MFQAPFSFNGRIRRSEFGFSVIIYAVFYILLTGIVSSKSEGMDVLGIIFIPMFWFIWAQAAKRCHDLGKNGFWQLVPLYGFFLIFKDGDFGINKYGENPKGLTLADYRTVYQSPFPVITKENCTESGSGKQPFDLTKNL